MIKSRIVSYGDLNIDILAQVERLHDQGEDTMVQNFHFSPGGSAANLAAVTAGLGGPARFVGIIGSDAFADMLLKDLVDHQVDVSAIHRVEGQNGAIIAIIDKAGERKFFSYRGVADACAYGEVPPGLMGKGDVLHVTGYSFQSPNSRVTASTLIQQAIKVGASISFDPSYLFAVNFKKDDYPFLASIDYFFPNREEAFLITKSRDLKESARRLLDFGIKNVFIKSGAQGCFVANQNLQMHIGAYAPQRIVDTTGAGDAFAGGALAALIKGCSIIEAAHIGCATAAFVISAFGGHALAPNRADLEAFAEQSGSKELIAAIDQMKDSTSLDKSG
jgi:sugar/nucleoside kinase (ribokinase family)